MLELLAARPGERILDLGCGTGHLTAQIAACGALVVGIDSSPEMIAEARQNRGLPAAEDCGTEPIFSCRASIRERGQSTMSYETLLFTKRDGIAYVSMNRPEKLNVLSRAVLGELRQCFEALRDDQEVRSVILSGEGERAFAAGADIREIAALDAMQGREAARRGQETFNLVENLGKPVIAAIHGYAVGGGCELAMACTFRVVSESARLGQPEVKIGVIPGYGGSQRLPRLVGKARALEMILTGEPITAQDALRIGLVDRVAPEGKLIETAEALARKIMANAPLAISLALQAVNFGMTAGKQEGMRFEAALFGICCGTADMKEGTRAFLEKRPAKFSGK